MKFTKVDNKKSIVTLNIDKFDLLKINQMLDNNKKIKLLYVFNFEDESVEMYGYDNGIEKNINMLDLPSPIDNIFYYNDLLFFSKNNLGEYLDFDENDFDDFYDSIFENFEDLDDYLEEDKFIQDDDYISDDGFVIN